MIFPLVYSPWRNRKSMYFDGISATVQSAASAALSDHTRTAGTLSVWFRVHAAFTGVDYLAWKGNAWGIYPGATIGFVVYQGGNSYSALSFGNALGETWHHAMMTWRRGELIRGYIDGVLKATKALPDAAVNTTAVPFAVASNGQAGGYCPVYVDECSVWGAQLGDGGVSVGQTAGGAAAELYNAGAPGLLYEHSAAADLAMWWRLGDADAFPVVTDWSGNGYHGAAVNMAADDIVEVTP